MRATALVAGLGPCTPLAVEAQLRSVTYATGFSSPVGFEQDPSDPANQYVVEQRGVIRLIRNGAVQPTPFLDMSTLVLCCGERGLLGLAFPPNYGASGRFYVQYTRAGDGRMVVARYRRSINPLVAESQGVALVWSTGEDSIRHPQSNHNAGCLAFGADGYLYVAQGDGGGGGDPENNAQNPNELLGKILRIDVNVSDNHPQGFVVPAGNAGLPRPEIWSLGWRNPWKFSFDDPARGGTGPWSWRTSARARGKKSTTNLQVAAGATTAGVSARAPTTTPAVPREPLVDPVFDYDHVEGRSITGGYIYRGAAFPALRGRYFFGDYATRRVWSLNLRVNTSTGEASRSVAADLVEHTADLGGTTVLGGISAFGVDAAGELYIVNYSAGTILKIVGARPCPPRQPTSASFADGVRPGSDRGQTAGAFR